MSYYFINVYQLPIGVQFIGIGHCYRSEAEEAAREELRCEPRTKLVYRLKVTPKKKEL